MPKFDVTKLSTATKVRSRFRLALSGALAIALAAGLAIMVRSEVRAADARRRTASSNPHPKAARSSAIPARVEQNPTAKPTLVRHTSTQAGRLTPTFSATRRLGRKTPTSLPWASRSTILQATNQDHASARLYGGDRPCRVCRRCSLANDPTRPISKLPIAEKLKVRGKEDMQRVYLFLGNSMIKNEPIKELTSPEVAGNVWKQIVSDRGQVLPARKVHDLRGL